MISAKLLSDLTTLGFRELDCRIASDLADKFFEDVVEMLAERSATHCTNTPQSLLLMLLSISYLGSYSRDKMPVVLRLISPDYTLSENTK